MIRKKKDHIEWLEFELFADEPLIHGVFLRHGGVSLEPYFSLNVSGAGDTFSNVQENRRRIFKTLSLDSVISADQIHGTCLEWSHSLKKETKCDGMITKEKHCGLLISHADCQAAIFYDPLCHTVANVHAGWRGQVQNIYQKTISMMENHGSKRENLLVAISPSLGPLNSEFKHFQRELPEEFYPFQVKPTYFDLWAIARYQLEKEGVLPHHIQIASIDTYSHPEDFYSYRREKALGRTEKITGCHGTVVALK